MSEQTTSEPSVRVEGGDEPNLVDDGAPAPTAAAEDPPAATEAVAVPEPDAGAEASADAEPAATSDAEPTVTADTEAVPEPAAETKTTPDAGAEAKTTPDAGAEASAAAPAQPSRPGRPGPRGGVPSRPRPSRGPRSGGPAPVVVRPPSDPTPWGRMTDEGVVVLITHSGERPVGTVVDATEEAALAHFGREFDAVVAQVDLQEQRLMAGGVPPGEVLGALRVLRTGLADASVVGDVDALARRLRDLEELASQRRADADAARAAAREQALAERTALVDEVEAIAATDPERMQWRPAGDRLRELLDAWKGSQHSSRLDKSTEDDLWKRFSAARTSFDRARRTWFAALETTSAAARTAKEALVTEAEKLSTSTDWASTSTAYRQLMDRWKAAGRTSRKEDDALWARFRAAQDVFFTARGAANSAEDAEFGANLEVKEALLAEAEALLPVKDARRARTVLRGIQERWEAAGKVPRADLQRIEKRLRAVESAVTDADSERWSRSNPETRARAQGAVEQLERSVAGLEADLASARERQDARAVEAAESSLSARREWLAAARRTAVEFG